MSIVALVNKTVVEATENGPIVKPEVVKREVVESREVVNLTIINESGALVEAELIGAINGQNKVFSTPTGYKAGTVQVRRNGLQLTRNKHFSELGNRQIEFVEAPKNIKFTDELIAFYEEV